MAGEAGQKACASCPHKHGAGGHDHAQGAAAHKHEGCCKGGCAGVDGKGCPMKLLGSDKVELKVEDTPTGAIIRVNAKGGAPADVQKVREAARSLTSCCPAGAPNAPGMPHAH
jgi:hypothetical protein